MQQQLFEDQIEKISVAVFLNVKGICMKVLYKLRIVLWMNMLSEGYAIERDDDRS